MTPYLKAIYGAILAGLGAAQTAYLVPPHHIGWGAAIGVTIATVTTLGVVWGIPNSPKAKP